MKKIRVGIIYGGQSSEHDVSIQSAKNIEAAIDAAVYEVVMIYVERDGTWNIPLGELSERIDVAFPIIHGTTGEDGVLQGTLTLLGIPFVGCDVFGSAAGMDKDITKKLVASAGVSVVPWITLRRGESLISFEECAAQLGGEVLFIKPARNGSSVGVSKVKSADEFRAAVSEAFALDAKILIETAVTGRELEVAVMMNPETDMLEAAEAIGEITMQTGDFYSYDAKYVSENAAQLCIPPQPELASAIAQQLRNAAITVCAALECWSFARVDFFLAQDGVVYLNEINTLPGFTNISMFPKLWVQSGLEYSQIIDRLIRVALQKA